MFLQLFNTSLRLASLALKLLLTLYMGKYLGLSDIGTYGLVAAYVAISIPLLGFRLDYIVMRDIVDVPALELAIKMRDQAVFYALNYLFLIVVVIGGLLFLPVDLNPRLVIFTLLLAILESFATTTSGNLISLKRPILANALFFLRAASWVLPVIALGLYDEKYRTDNVVFLAWLIGVILSLMVTAIMFRDFPWREALKVPVHWQWIIKSVKHVLPMWISGICGAVATNLDRFVVENFLGREFVGIVSFYGSFVISIFSLLANGIFLFGYPHMIQFYKNGNYSEFYKIAKTMSWQASASTAVMVTCIGLIIPYLGNQFGRPEFAQYAPVLWLMLFGAWMRASSDALYYIMYARHQDREIWISNFIMLLCSLGFNIGLIYQFGFVGVGYSAVLTAIAICAWRLYAVMKHPKEDGVVIS